jgi:hypothetical protein
VQERQLFYRDFLPNSGTGYKMVWDGLLEELGLPWSTTLGTRGVVCSQMNSDVTSVLMNAFSENHPIRGTGRHFRSLHISDV